MVGKITHQDKQWDNAKSIAGAQGVRQEAYYPGANTPALEGPYPQEAYQSTGKGYVHPQNQQN